MEPIYLAAKLFDDLSSNGHAPSVRLDLEQDVLSVSVGGGWLPNEHAFEMAEHSTHFRVIIEMQLAEFVDNLRGQVLPDETSKAA